MKSYTNKHYKLKKIGRLLKLPTLLYFQNGIFTKIFIHTTNSPHEKTYPDHIFYFDYFPFYFLSNR